MQKRSPTTSKKHHVYLMHRLHNPKFLICPICRVNSDRVSLQLEYQPSLTTEINTQQRHTYTTLKTLSSYPLTYTLAFSRAEVRDNLTHCVHLKKELRPKMTQTQSLYLSQKIWIGTITLTHTLAHSWTHTSLPTLQQTPSYTKNPQFPPNSITREKCYQHYEYSVSTTKTITSAPTNK